MEGGGDPPKKKKEKKKTLKEVVWLDDIKKSWGDLGGF